MIYCFDDFELDAGKVELRANGAAIPLEPQVFALLLMLIENRERMVSKDEIVAQVWDGRIVSDSAVASRVKSARQALGDDGRAQRFIKTVHGLGFRFVADVNMRAAASNIRELMAPGGECEAPVTSRPSIAVLPFRLVGVAGPYAPIAEALPQDMITELSRLHWLFVIARASSFRFRSSEADIDTVRTALNVRYVMTGVVEIVGSALTVSVELSDAQDRGVVWTDRYKGDLNAVHDIRQEIVRNVIAALEVHIPLNEARRARFKSKAELDAWSSYHLGLQHMYRFTKADNALATSLFERAAVLDPEFARAYAGLSFTRFQDAFLGYVSDVDEARRQAHDFAERAIERDPLDPFSNLTRGRAFLLTGDLESSQPWLERATQLNPNYAQGHYSRSWTKMLIGDADGTAGFVDAALSRSPLDPLLYAMLAMRSFTHIIREENEMAAHWAERAARTPGAHVLIEMTACVAHALNGDDFRAKAWAAHAKARAPNFSTATFFRAFPLRDMETRKRLTSALARCGF
ncbi:MAG: winged helix-turn-helix domain-containing protein [Terricaulis silvestris]